MERLGSSLEHELGRFGAAAGMAEIVAAWPGSVGETVARNAWPARLGRDGTLHVAACSSTWAFELGQLRQTMLERLREALGDAAPAKLRFTVGRLPEPARTPSPAPAARARPGVRDVAEGARLAAVIEHAELRAAVARAAALGLARGAARRGF